MKQAQRRNPRADSAGHAILTVPLALALGLGATPGPGTASADEVTLTAAPAVGVALECHSSLEVEFDETAIGFKIDGENGEDHDRLLHALLGQDLRWTERTQAAEGGRPTVLSRRFNAVRGSFAFEGIGDPQNLRESTGEFENRTVTFDWDVEAAAYDRTLEEASEDDQALESQLVALRPIVDLSGFLPERAVTVGDHWRVKGSAFAAAFSPCGDLALDPKSDRLIALGTYTGFTSPMVPMRPASWFADLAADSDEGATVELLEIVIDPATGSRIAVLDVQADLTAEADLAEWLLGFATDNFEPEVQKLAVEARVDGEGELRWNLDLQRVQSWEFEGDLRLELDAAWELRQGRTYRLESTRSMEGKIRSSFECRVATEPANGNSGGGDR